MVPKTEKPEISDYQGKIREKNWLGSKDSNLDCMIQSRMAYRDECPDSIPFKNDRLFGLFPNDLFI
jgi:hypothetical protein